jgi:Protein of unknown function (DUF3099)
VGDVTATRDPAERRARLASTAGLSKLLPSRFRHRERAAAQEPVYQITSARRGVRDDVERRTRRYLISMGVRTACFLGAVVAGGWLRWVLIAGALVLPYLAVVFANGGRERVGDGALFHDEDVRAIRAPDL